VIIAQGGSTNGWSLYSEGGKLKYCYNFFGIDVTSSRRRSRSRRAITRSAWSSKYDGGGLGKGGAVTLYVDGKRSARARRADGPDGLLGRRDLRRRQGGRLAGVARLRSDGNEFSGEVNWVQIDLEKDDHDHLISPEERFSVAMARQ
jgi:arylsulfatase